MHRKEIKLYVQKIPLPLCVYLVQFAINYRIFVFPPPFLQCKRVLKAHCSLKILNASTNCEKVPQARSQLSSYQLESTLQGVEGSLIYIQNLILFCLTEKPCQDYCSEKNFKRNFEYDAFSGNLSLILYVIRRIYLNKSEANCNKQMLNFYC